MLCVQQVCTTCGATKTPMWRNGPNGQKTLCNACGVRLQRAQTKARQKAQQAANSEASLTDDLAVPLMDSQQAGSTGLRRHSSITLKGKGSRSLSSADFADLTARAEHMPHSPYEESSPQSNLGVPTMQQKRKPLDGLHQPPTGGLVRKRSCQRLEQVGEPERPITEILTAVEGLDLIVAGSMGHGSTRHTCVTGVRAALCATHTVRTPVPGPLEGPYVLSIFTKEGRLLAVARSAEMALQHSTFSRELQCFLWDSRCNWSLASVSREKFSLFQGMHMQQFGGHHSRVLSAAACIRTSMQSTGHQAQSPYGFDPV